MGCDFYEQEVIRVEYLKNNKKLSDTFEYGDCKAYYVGIDYDLEYDEYFNNGQKTIKYKHTSDIPSDLMKEIKEELSDEGKIKILLVKHYFKRYIRT